MEKQRTTPDAYPLSLNSLRLACNQATNRDPVVQYDETTIREALQRLERHGLVRLASGAGSRAAKYRHLLDEKLPLHAPEHAIMCTLMLRGSQTPGELKQRSDRLHAFAGLDAVNEALEALIARELVERLPRRPGQKEERCAHRLGEGDMEREGAAHGQYAGLGAAADANGPGAAIDAAADAGWGTDEPSPSTAGELERRVARLERAVAELQARLAADGATAARSSA
jgi:uncharacterized protein YceH (UPF0502 family)